MLDCHIVKDLLPNYVDGLLSKKTEQEVAQHLQDCEDCQALYNQMKTPIDETPIKTSDKEINYMKKIKTKGALKIAAGIVTIIIIFVALAALFVIGTPVASMDMAYSATTIPGDKWLIDMQLSNSKALVVRSESIYGVNSDGEKIVVGHILKPYEVLPFSLIQDGDSFSFGCSFETPLEQDYAVVIRFKDKDVFYSMKSEGLF